MNKIELTIEKAITCIQSEQRPDGSFPSFSSTNPDDFSEGIPRSTTFFAANILTCLQICLKTEEADLSGYAKDAIKDISAKIAGFLLAQKNEQWSFNYWAKNSPESASLPYPDDLDDTFAAFAALARYDKSLIDAKTLAAIAKLLISQEVREGGPYRTWVVGKGSAPAWRDVDVVVNSTICHFLSLVDVRLSPLESFLGEKAEGDLVTSPYYPGPIHMNYFLSRDSRTADFRVRQTPRANLTALERALLISAGINHGLDHTLLAEEMASLLKEVEANGFAPNAFCIDPAQNQIRSYAGSAALTAVFCLEAIVRYPAYASKKSAASTIMEPTPHSRVRALAREACIEAGPLLSDIALAQIEKMTDERITGLSYDFRKTLADAHWYISKELTEQLSLANLYGWIAYTLYDDVLDEEADPLLIPCANFFLRKLTDIYHGLEKDIPGIKALFTATMDRMDDANAWEQRNCRISRTFLERKNKKWGALFADHSNLADRSFGHILGPLAQLLYVGYTPHSKEYKNTVTFFHHYLIARQIHDDVHDWTEDLLRGRVNSTAALIMDQIPTGQSIENALPTMQKIFWEQTINAAVRLIDLHVSAAREAKQRSNLLSQTNFMEDVLQELEDAANNALEERDGAIKFLEYFRSDPAALGLHRTETQK